MTILKMIYLIQDNQFKSTIINGLVSHSLVGKDLVCLWAPIIPTSIHSKVLPKIILVETLRLILVNRFTSSIINYQRYKVELSRQARGSLQVSQLDSPSERLKLVIIFLIRVHSSHITSRARLAKNFLILRLPVDNMIFIKHCMAKWMK